MDSCLWTLVEQERPPLSHLGTCRDGWRQILESSLEALCSLSQEMYTQRFPLGPPSCKLTVSLALSRISAPFPSQCSLLYLRA